MIGAIIGDIVGSRFEWNNIKTKEFTFFHPDCHFTDESVMTLAVGDALLEHIGSGESRWQNSPCRRCRDMAVSIARPGTEAYSAAG